MSGTPLRRAVLSLGAVPPGREGGALGRLRLAALRLLLRVELRRRPLPALLAALDAPAAPPGAAPPPVPVSAGAGVPPRAWRATCLDRALAGFAALRARGADARLVIGVRPGAPDLLAHAWLEVGGRPIGEPGDPRATWTVAFTHPDDAVRAPREGPMTALQPARDVILTELEDGTGVLLHLGTKFYYALNRTGVAVWKLVSAGEAAGADDLARALAARFAGTPPERARADVDALLAELRAEGLLAPGGGP